MFRKESGSIDLGFTAIVALIGVIVLWLLLMPWVSAIATSTLHRFHLRSSSFVWWAIQTPIPSMYNFANTYVVEEIPPGLVDPLFPPDEVEPRYVNHYPTRLLTFGGARYRNLNQHEDRWMTITSSYRGKKLVTRFHAEPVEGSRGFKLNRLDEDGANQ